MTAALKEVSAWTIDASVALKWLLLDEAEPASTSLLVAFLNDEIELFAPSFIRYEIASGLIKAVRRNRIERDEVVEGVRKFMALRIHDASDADDLVKRALVIANESGGTPYDATYVAHAESLGIGVISSDRGMLSRSGRFPVRVVSLKDIPV